MILLRSAIVALMLLPIAAMAAESEALPSCESCHAGDAGDEESELGLDTSFADDVHKSVGLSCHDCHGGNPDPALGDDMLGAKEGDFVGAPTREQIPAFCGRCHSDPSYMKRFNPAARVDQETEYRTSEHGRLLAAGDPNVATCIDCHGVHGILRSTDTRSPVYPSRVAETCAGCHADAERMEGYLTTDGRALPIDQFARWRTSVHGVALIDRSDLYAPTCNDCHGNHGATPPDVDSVAYVCGSCHGREAELFRASEKRQGFVDHNDFGLAELGERPCEACHDASEPAASLTGVHSFSECTLCHGNHSVVEPNITQLGPLPQTPCAICHELPATVAEQVEPAATLRGYEELRDGLLAAGRAEGLDATELFDHLVDQALRLPQHSRSVVVGDAAPDLRPEFAKLLEKFRIGRSSYSHVDPVSGQEVRETRVRCDHCHAEQPLATDVALGWNTSSEYLERMRSLTALTAAAERTALRARRGGVEVHDTYLSLEKAVDAQIALEVLVHTFEVEGAFAEKHDEGIVHARSALASAQAALDELRARRTGLAFTLIVILLVLVALGLKIRSLSDA